MGHFTQDNPPDIRLAKAFKFTMDDLNANRSGILSWRQRGISDWLAFRISYGLRQIPFISQFFTGSVEEKKQPYQISSVCGRIKLEHHIVDKRLIRSSLFYEYYQLVFPGHNLTLHITRPQFSILTENLKYRVYYQHSNGQNHILSIERIIGDCP